MNTTESKKALEPTIMAQFERWQNTMNSLERKKVTVITKYVSNPVTILSTRCPALREVSVRGLWINKSQRQRTYIKKHSSIGFD
jgi:hypothetical protein